MDLYSSFMIFIIIWVVVLFCSTPFISGKKITSKIIVKKLIITSLISLSIWIPTILMIINKVLSISSLPGWPYDKL